MKIIFLDFDGVILTLRTCAAQSVGWSRATPDPVLVTAITRCCEAGAHIVVSSTWRTGQESCWGKLDECNLRRFLHADWRTPEFQSEGTATSRPAEIADWLSRHPEVTEYRILDDDPWHWLEAQKPCALKCDAEDGAGARVILALLEWAGVKRKAIEPASTEETARYARTA